MNLREQLKREEGVRPSAYADHLGFLTIGVGRLIDSRKGGKLSQAEIEFLLDNDIAAKTAEVVAALPWVSSLNETRQAVLIGMAFQMGTNGLIAFTNTLNHIKAGRYKDAARGMLASKWAQQTPGRAGRLAAQMEFGEWR